MLESSAALSATAVDATVDSGAETAPTGRARFGGQFQIDPHPPAVIAAADAAGVGAAEPLAASRHLLAQSPGERLLDTLFATANELRRPPHGDVVDLSRRGDVDRGDVDRGDAGGRGGPERLRELTEDALHRYRQISDKAVAVEIWSARVQLTTAVAAKGLQGVNTLLKNQG